MVQPGGADRWEQAPAPVPALLQSQAYVVDLTEAYDQLSDLIPRRLAPELPPKLLEPKRELHFNAVTAEFAGERPDGPSGPGPDR